MRALKNLRCCYIIDENYFETVKGDSVGLRFEIRGKLDSAAGTFRHLDARAGRQAFPRRQKTFNRRILVHDDFLSAVHKFRRRKIDGLA